MNNILYNFLKRKTVLLGLGLFLLLVLAYFVFNHNNRLTYYNSMSGTAVQVNYLSSSNHFFTSSFWKTLHDPVVQINDAKALKDYYAKLDYDLKSVRKGKEAVPKIMLSQIPKGWTEIKDIPKKKNLFIKTLLPMILYANEEILQKRELLTTLMEKKEAGKDLSFNEQKWVETLALDYKGDTENLKDLLSRVDIIPTSLALAQAIEESGWGTSYFVRKGNALFGQVSWTRGMPPRTNPKGVKTRDFNSLLESVQSYAHNLNTHSAYSNFRKLRAKQRATKGQLDGFGLTRTLIKYSERRKKYIKNLQKIIDKNNLREFENVQLKGGKTYKIDPKTVYF